ncbi:hypothetical protein GB937_009137 [Aspergillus fischeri]|nr:hypothetical protein GB937_009137 [Aspergillus fischeri]
MSLIHPFIARVDLKDLRARQQLEDLNAFILDICIRYLLLDDIDQRSLFSEEQMAIAELPQDDDLFNDNKEPV